MIEQIRRGQVRGLAVTTAKRSQLAPELPSVAEAAFCCTGDIQQGSCPSRGFTYGAAMELVRGGPAAS